MKPIRAFASELLESACGIAKAEKLDDPHEDLLLTVLYVPRGSRKATLICPVGAEGIEPPLILMTALRAAYETSGPPAIIVTSADAHMKVLPPDTNLDNFEYQRGDFAKDPASKELLAISAYCRDDDGHILVSGRYLPYGYDDDGSIRFDEVINLEEPPGGVFDEIIRAAFAKGQR